MIEFDKERLERFLQAHLTGDNSEIVKNFFADPQIQDMLINNDYEQLYQKWKQEKYSIEVLTAIILLSNIDFLPYMKTIPEFCFYRIPIAKIQIPKNITAIMGQAFGICPLPLTIEYLGSLADWAKVHIDDDWAMGTRMSELITGENK